MLIGVPKEIKSDEYRVGLTPESVQALTEANHEVMVLSNAGLGIGKTDEEFKQSGALIVKTREEIFDQAEMIVKVKDLYWKNAPCLKKTKFYSRICI